MLNAQTRFATKHIDDPGGSGTDRVNVSGSVTLVERLLAADLLTELRIIVHPVVVGVGRRLLAGWSRGRITLDLVETTPLDRGARVDVFRPVH